MIEYVEEDYRRVVADPGPTRRLPGTSIEIVREARPASPPRHVLFDFDGTLSLIREGWPDVMVSMMAEVLREAGAEEPPERLHDLVREFVMQLNGKQTIYQMIRLGEEVARRGGSPRPPLEYKEIYHERLMKRIRSRREALRTGRARPEQMLTPGALEILASLRQRGVRLYLASGTDLRHVQEEAALLELTPFFENRIYGAVDDYKSFSKARVIEQILEENRVDGAALLGFGDGYVEIQNIKSAGGVAVAVASDEAGRSGKPDAWKRDRLIGVGADMVIPDFREYERVIEYFWE